MPAAKGQRLVMERKIARRSRNPPHVETIVRKPLGWIDETVQVEPKAILTACVRRSSACGVVVNFLDEQVSPTQILVLPAVPLPGKNGEKRST